MKKSFFIKLFPLLLLLLGGVQLFSQDGSSDNGDKNPVAKNSKGFHMGIFVGTLFANKYTASLYDGYGYDLSGQKNNFDNSWMNNKINFEYAGANGFNGGDRIATALNVNHGDWSFDETDMPVNLKYNVAIMLGANMRYCFNNKDAVILNVNASKLTVAGDFTITLTTSPINTTTPGYVNYKTFSIIGGEQRLLFQIGYQRIMGDEDQQFNFFMEGGPIVSMVKFDKNQIKINNLTIDITTQYNNIGYLIYRAKILTGVGIGAFAGLGINVNINPKWTLQLLYTPSMENINIGQDPRLTLQHAIGLRGYYNF